MELEKFGNKKNIKSIVILSVSFVASILAYYFKELISEPWNLILLNMSVSVFTASGLYFLLDFTFITELTEATHKAYQRTLYAPQSLETSLTREFRETALKNSMRKTIGDKKISDEVYNYIDLVSDSFKSGVIKGYDEKTILEEIDGTCYGKIHKKVTYRRRNFPKKLIFECKIIKDKKEAALFTRKTETEKSWIFLPERNSSELPEDAFVISNLRFREEFNETVHPAVNKVGANYIRYTFEVPDDVFNDENFVPIFYDIDVKQNFNVGFYSFGSALPIKGLRLKVVHKSPEKFLYPVITGITSSDFPRVINDSENAAKENSKIIKMEDDHWFLPTSQLVFSWGQTTK